MADRRLRALAGMASKRAEPGKAVAPLNERFPLRQRLDAGRAHLEEPGADDDRRPGPEGEREGSWLHDQERQEQHEPDDRRPSEDRSGLIMSEPT